MDASSNKECSSCHIVDTSCAPLHCHTCDNGLCVDCVVDACVEALSIGPASCPKCSSPLLAAVSDNKYTVKRISLQKKGLKSCRGDNLVYAARFVAGEGSCFACRPVSEARCSMGSLY